jgi:segregation and condensation protein A
MPEDFAPGADAAETTPIDGLILEIDGFEGPLDLLLTLAQGQKVDLRCISILQLAEQYLRFIAEARRLRIELAADYLVMAAWLAFLKSRLLLPKPAAEDGPSGEELAARLARQLARLEAIRRAAAQLMAQDRLGQQVFARGMPEALGLKKQVHWQVGLGDLLRAYANIQTRESYQPLHMKRAPVLTLEDAYARLSSIMGDGVDWSSLQLFLPDAWADTPQRRRSATASTFAAALELAKRGELEMRQSAPFAPLYLRSKARDAA